MHWATRRRLTIGAALVVAVLMALALFLTVALYQPPSCVDHAQNQDEEGIDCGGSCAYLCRAGEEAPITPVPRLLRNASGRSDLVASIENRNSDAAAKNVSFSVKVYDAQFAFVREITGSLDLPPRTVMPIFIPGVAGASEGEMHASLEIATSTLHWVRVAGDPRIVPVVAHTQLSGTTTAPRVEAILTNPSITSLSRIPVVALVRDTASGNVIAASQTVVTIVPQGETKAIFTWNEPFKSLSVRIEVIPVVPLP